MVTSYITPEQWEEWERAHPSAASALRAMQSRGEYLALLREWEESPICLTTPEPPRRRWLRHRLADMEACLPSLVELRKT